MGDSIVLWQNPKRTSNNCRIDNAHPLLAEQFHFPFAEDYYVLIVNQPYAGMQINIEDPDGKKSKGDFISKTLYLLPQFFHPLCTEESDWNQKGGDFVKGYYPIAVELEEKANPEAAPWGNYQLDRKATAETCNYSSIRLKRSGKLILRDDELPINTMEIPNTNKVTGTYEFINDTTLRFHYERVVYRYHRIGASRFIRWFSDRKRVVKELSSLEGSTYFLKGNKLLPEFHTRFSNSNNCIFRKK